MLITATDYAKKKRVDKQMLMRIIKHLNVTPEQTIGNAQMFPVELEPLPGVMPWWRRPKDFREKCMRWCRNHNARLIECDPVSMDMTFTRDGKIWTRKMEVEE